MDKYDEKAHYLCPRNGNLSHGDTCQSCRRIAAALRQAVEDVIDQVDDWDPMMADCLRKEFLPTPDKLSNPREEIGR